MTHTTPEQARKIARDLDDHNSSLDRASRIALRSLADQLEAVTADCEKFANQTFAAKAEAKTLVDHANAERDKCGSGAGCLHKDALIDSLTAERDAYKLDARRLDAERLDWFENEHRRNKCDAAIAKEAK